MPSWHFKANVHFRSKTRPLDWETSQGVQQTSVQVTTKRFSSVSSRINPWIRMDHMGDMSCSRHHFQRTCLG